MVIYLNLFLILIIIIILVYPMINKMRIKSVAKIVDTNEFTNHLTGGQLIDLREAADYRRGHILGARNLPFSQFDQSISAIRKDKPILFYENKKPIFSIRAVLKLKKVGYTNIFILKRGFKEWNGKVKKGA